MCLSLFRYITRNKNGDANVLQHTRYHDNGEAKEERLVPLVLYVGICVTSVVFNYSVIYENIIVQDKRNIHKKLKRKVKLKNKDSQYIVC